MVDDIWKTADRLGSAIAPAIFGVIADTYDLHTAFLFLAGTIVFANALIFFMPNGAQNKPHAAAASSLP